MPNIKSQKKRVLITKKENEMDNISFGFKVLLGVCLAARRMHTEGKTVPPELLMPEYLRLSQAERERRKRLSAGEN